MSVVANRIQAPCPVIEAHTGKMCNLKRIGLKDYCSQHQRRYKHDPDVELGSRPLGKGLKRGNHQGDPTTCQIPGCTWVKNTPASDVAKARFTYHNGYGYACQGHTQRIWDDKTGVELSAPFFGRGWTIPCAISDCTWAETTKSQKFIGKRHQHSDFGWLCHGHYGRARKNLDMHAPFRNYQPIPDGQTCDVEGCDTLVKQLADRGRTRLGRHIKGYGYACASHTCRWDNNGEWGGDIRPTKSHESYTLKRLRSALKKHGAELVQTPTGELDYRDRIQVRCLKCKEEADKSIVKICNGFEQGICGNCGQGGYKNTKPGVLYLISREGVLKIGITNQEFFRLKEHVEFGWEVVRVWKDKDGRVPEKLERDVLHHWREVLDAPRALTKADMPQHGYTETATMRKVGLQKTLDYIDSQIQQKLTKEYAMARWCSHEL
jgi:hypothetical protein